MDKTHWPKDPVRVREVFAPYHAGWVVEVWLPFEGWQQLAGTYRYSNEHGAIDRADKERRARGRMRQRLTVTVDIGTGGAVRPPEQVLRTIAKDVENGEINGQGGGYDWRIEGIDY